MTSESIREKLKSELCDADIKDLVRSFAAGNLFEVSVSESIIEVGVIMAENDHQKLQGLLTSGKIKKLDDKTFQAWFDEEKIVQILIISPFVLAQEKDISRHIH